MSGAEPRIRAIPARSSSPSEGTEAVPASIVGEPAASEKSPPGRSVKTGSAI